MWCQTYGYLPSRKVSPPIGWYQIILLGDRGTCVLTTCPGLHSAMWEVHRPVGWNRQCCWHRADWSTSDPCMSHTADVSGQRTATEVHHRSTRIATSERQSESCTLGSGCNRNHRLLTLTRRAHIPTRKTLIKTHISNNDKRPQTRRPNVQCTGRLVGWLVELVYAV